MRERKTERAINKGREREIDRDIPTYEGLPQALFISTAWETTVDI